MNRTGIGPDVKSDTLFRRRMRRHQGWYRHHVLGLPYGAGPSSRNGKPLGNMLTWRDAEDGRNFLNSRVFELAKRRLADKKGTVEPFRLKANMLSSQPMCFNLFGELALDAGLATKLVRALWGQHIVQVRCVRFEWAPKCSGEYLGDRTAFDAFIEYEMADGSAGFIGIETKLSEPFSPPHYCKPRYRQWMQGSHPWGRDEYDPAPGHNQLWRNHLLAWSLLKHPDSRYARGEFAVVYHPEDRPCRTAVEAYRRSLRDPATFASFDLAAIVTAWKPLAGAWLREFERRYLALRLSEAARDDAAEAS